MFDKLCVKLLIDVLCVNFNFNVLLFMIVFGVGSNRYKFTAIFIDFFLWCSYVVGKLYFNCVNIFVLCV